MGAPDRRVSGTCRYAVVKDLVAGSCLKTPSLVNHDMVSMAAKSEKAIASACSQETIETICLY